MDAIYVLPFFTEVLSLRVVASFYAPASGRKTKMGWVGVAGMYPSSFQTKVSTLMDVEDSYFEVVLGR